MYCSLFSFLVWSVTPSSSISKNDAVESSSESSSMWMTDVVGVLDALVALGFVPSFGAFVGKLGCNVAIDSPSESDWLSLDCEGVGELGCSVAIDCLLNNVLPLLADERDSFEAMVFLCGGVAFDWTDACKGCKVCRVGLDPIEASSSRLAAAASFQRSSIPAMTFWSWSSE